DSLELAGERQEPVHVLVLVRVAVLLLEMESVRRRSQYQVHAVVRKRRKKLQAIRTVDLSKFSLVQGLHRADHRYAGPILISQHTTVRVPLHLVAECVERQPTCAGAWRVSPSLRFVRRRNRSSLPFSCLSIRPESETGRRRRIGLSHPRWPRESF